MYIDDLFYFATSGKPDMDSAAFFRAEYRARKIVDRLTQGRVKAMKEVPEAVQMLMVELVTLEATQGGEITENQAVTSFSNDGYSEIYADPLTVERVKELEENLVLEYLEGEKDDNGVPLLFLGVKP